MKTKQQMIDEFIKEKGVTELPDCDCGFNGYAGREKAESQPKSLKGINARIHEKKEKKKCKFCGEYFAEKDFSSVPFKVDQIFCERCGFLRKCYPASRNFKTISEYEEFKELRDKIETIDGINPYKIKLMKQYLLIRHNKHYEKSIAAYERKEKDKLKKLKNDF